MIYEYMVVTKVVKLLKNEEIEEWLNVEGLHAWELVAVEPGLNSLTNQFYFRRAKTGAVKV